MSQQSTLMSFFGSSNSKKKKLQTDNRRNAFATTPVHGKAPHSPSLLDCLTSTERTVSVHGKPDKRERPQAGHDTPLEPSQSIKRVARGLM